MNPRLDLLQPYPFEKLNALLAGARPPADLAPVNLYIGEPQHPTPALLTDAIKANLGGLARYPVTRGLPELRQAIAAWIGRRYALEIDAETQVLPVAGTREALFAIAHVVVDAAADRPLVVCPNPFYQIYEGAALLAGATPYFINALAANGYAPDWDAVPEDVWARAQLVYTCSPNNPNGRVMTMAEWEKLFALADRHGFVLVSDECYSEIYFDESAPPLEQLASQTLGFDKLVVMGSSTASFTRSTSGFAAVTRRAREVLPLPHLPRQHDGNVVRAFLDRRLERRGARGREPAPVPGEVRGLPRPGEPRAAARAAQAPLLLGGRAGRGHALHARALRVPAREGAAGSYLSREAGGTNPGRGHVRIALVSTVAEAAEAGRRIRDFVRAGGARV